MIQPKKSLKYLFFSFLGFWLLKNFYANYSLNEILKEIKEAKFCWIILATGIHLVNHFLRAYRWKILLQLQGFSPTLYQTFLAEMTGFFSNVFVPRLGEWTRCKVLKETNNIPIVLSFATVIVERVIDIVFFVFLLVSIPLGVFMFGNKEASNFFVQIFSDKIVGKVSFSLGKLFCLLLVFFFALVLIRYLFKKSLKRFSNFWGIILQTIKATKHADTPMLWLFSCLIWLTSFLVEYISFFSLQATSEIGILPGLCIFIVLSIGLAIPIPGNVGAYHMLMYASLSIFGITKNSATVYITLIHAIQLFNALVIGGIATIISIVLGNRAQKDMDRNMNNVSPK